MLGTATPGQLLHTVSDRLTLGWLLPQIYLVKTDIHHRVVKTIFVLGPSHHVRLSGCAVTQHVAYQTPLYDLR